MRRLGLVLAGGRSTRFGADKALEPVGGAPMIRRALGVLARGCDELAVSAPGSGAVAAWAKAEGLRLVSDARGGPDGPLAGVLAGLASARNLGAAVLVTAPCDAPALPANLARRLCAGLGDGAGAAFAVTDAGAEPLCAAWRAACEAPLAALLADGRHPAVKAALGALGAAQVRFPDTHAFANVNTRADLEALTGAADETRLFAFEQEFADSLRCIPMSVRFKLDIAGVKLSLRHWSRLTPDERNSLRLRACGSAAETKAYAADLAQLVEARTGERPAALSPDRLEDYVADDPPARVTARAAQIGLEAPGPAAWRALSPLERFALLKLSRESHDNVNFAPAMREFGLA